MNHGVPEGPHFVTFWSPFSTLFSGLQNNTKNAPKRDPKWKLLGVGSETIFKRSQSRFLNTPPSKMTTFRKPNSFPKHSKRGTWHGSQNSTPKRHQKAPKRDPLGGPVSKKKGPQKTGPFGEGWYRNGAGSPPQCSGPGDPGYIGIYI